jgi:hypothetical protein
VHSDQAWGFRFLAIGMADWLSTRKMGGVGIHVVGYVREELGAQTASQGLCAAIVYAPLVLESATL